MADLIDNDEVTTQKLPQTNPLLPTQDGLNVPPQTDAQNVPITDGAVPVPQDTTGIASGLYSLPNPVGQQDISFPEGNWKQMMAIPSQIEQKQLMLTLQVAPLVMVLLIELLGSSDLFSLKEGEANVIMGDKLPTITFTMVYSIPSWIGTEIDPKDSYKDASYVLNKISLVKAAHFNKCAIDTSNGLLTISGTI